MTHRKVGVEDFCRLALKHPRLALALSLAMASNSLRMYALLAGIIGYVRNDARPAGVCGCKDHAVAEVGVDVVCRAPKINKIDT